LARRGSERFYFAGRERNDACAAVCPYRAAAATFSNNERQGLSLPGTSESFD